MDIPHAAPTWAERQAARTIEEVRLAAIADTRAAIAAAGTDQARAAHRDVLAYLEAGG